MASPSPTITISFPSRPPKGPATPTKPPPPPFRISSRRRPDPPRLDQLDLAKIHPDYNQRVLCARLPLPSIYSDTLRQVSCWGTAFGYNQARGDPSYAFIAGMTSNGVAVFRYNQTNGPVRQLLLPMPRPWIETVQDGYVCLTSRSRSSFLIFNYVTDRAQPVARC